MICVVIDLLTSIIGASNRARETRTVSSSIISKFRFVHPPFACVSGEGDSEGGKHVQGGRESPRTTNALSFNGLLPEHLRRHPNTLSRFWKIQGGGTERKIGRYH